MKIYEAQLQYSLVKEGATAPLDLPCKVYQYMAGAFDKNPMQESFWVICLNMKNHPISRTMVSLGTISSAFANPREIFRIAILANAASIVITHNHPSGDPAPSRADIQVTRQLRECGKLMNIQLIDHVICGDSQSDPQGLGYYSFSEAGLL
jgi:DNA repair protein RadC